MKVDVKNQKNEVVEQIELNDKIFKVKANADTIFQVYTSMLSNRRQPLASTKDRSEVSGGGRKPWKQKGTGRARVGSIRSPIWVGGGVTFGPRHNEANFKKGVNQKMKQKALAMVLSSKVKDNELIILDKIELKNDYVIELIEATNFWGKKANDYISKMPKGTKLIAIHRDESVITDFTDLTIEEDDLLLVWGTNSRIWELEK